MYVSEESLMNRPFQSINTNNKWPLTQLTVFSFPECCRYRNTARGAEK